MLLSIKILKISEKIFHLFRWEIFSDIGSYGFIQRPPEMAHEFASPVSGTIQFFVIYFTLIFNIKSFRVPSTNSVVT